MNAWWKRPVSEWPALPWAAFMAMFTVGLVIFSITVLALYGLIHVGFTLCGQDLTKWLEVKKAKPK